MSMSCQVTLDYRAETILSASWDFPVNRPDGPGKIEQTEHISRNFVARFRLGIEEHAGLSRSRRFKAFEERQFRTRQSLARAG
jgi:hypothetical protein